MVRKEELQATIRSIQAALQESQQKLGEAIQRAKNTETVTVQYTTKPVSVQTTTKPVIVQTRTIQNKTASEIIQEYINTHKKQPGEKSKTRYEIIQEYTNSHPASTKTVISKPDQVVTTTTETTTTDQVVTTTSDEVKMLEADIKLKTETIELLNKQLSSMI